MSSLTDGLTGPQREAVEFYRGPLLILAGPGSGKTRVITRRIARLIERGVHEQSILAITFTNRAAREMQQRVDALLPQTRVWISTFHRFCASVLRRNSRHVGLESNFVIYDKSDQLKVIRHVLNELDIDAIRTPASRISSRISRIKNALGDPTEFARSLEYNAAEPLDQVVAAVFPRYQSTLLECNAVDFDDLLLHVVRLFAENPELRASYDEHFQFLLVDEYQDTNLAQYSLIRALSENVTNVCVTGDPDQSIYGWRGASIANILNFERDFPAASLIRLEQNFRSTRLILNAADRLIAHNRQRKAKSLVTDREDGEPVRLLTFEDARKEADGIAARIQQMVRRYQDPYSGFAVFYRVNSMSRELELAMTRARLPYQVAAGVAFYDRAEVRDLLAYLRAVDNPADQISTLRIINQPARGISAASQAVLQRQASEQGITILEAARTADMLPELKKTARMRIKAFAKMMDSFSLADSGSVSELLKTIVTRTSYHMTWGRIPSEQAIEKQANVEELINAAAQYDETHADDPSLTGFLETTALVADDDAIDASAGKVTLMTMHAAKGLEFPHVFITGVEHNLIPHERSLKAIDGRELEEERRLLFVGMTRAMRSLFFTTAKIRNDRGKPRMTIPSSFLGETSYVTVNDDGTEDAATVEDNGTSRDQELRERLKESMARSDRPLLTTGASLLKGSNEEASLPQSFAIGMRVKHPQNGVGTVVDVNGFAKRRTVTVAFQDAGGQVRHETYSVTRCPLQPVGIR